MEKCENALAKLHDKCLCHKEGVKGDLTAFTSVSWATFKRAAEIRQDHIMEQMKFQWDEGPIGKYHRVCYQNYTHSGHLQRFSKQQSKSPFSSSYKDPTLQSPVKKQP